MKTYNADLFCKLVEVFPESLNVSKVVTNYEYYNGPWGQEKVYKGTETVNLAESILNTAQATTHGGTDIESGLRYIEEFRPKRVQRQETKLFLRNAE